MKIEVNMFFAELTLTCAVRMLWIFSLSARLEQLAPADSLPFRFPIARSPINIHPSSRNLFSEFARLTVM
jgi:hypothetical protein